MKKVIASVFFSLLCGTVFGLIMYKTNEDKIATVFNESKTIYLFQVGYFSSYDNALTMKKMTGGIIIPNDNKYRVVVSILSDKTNVSKCKEYLNSLKSSYYLKKEEVSNQDFIDYLNEVETLYQNTNDYEVIKELNSKIILKYEELEI